MIGSLLFHLIIPPNLGEFLFSIFISIIFFSISPMGVYLQCVHVWLYRLGSEQLYIVALNLSLLLHATLVTWRNPFTIH